MEKGLRTNSRLGIERLVPSGACVCVGSVSLGNVTRATKPITADQAEDYTACV